MARFSGMLAAVVWLAPLTAAHAQPATTSPPPRTYMGRTIAPFMSYSGADWLVRPERDAEEAPAKLLDALDLRRGQTVCDFGCGNGYHTLELAKRVGPAGLVYAVDIQQEMLDSLADRAKPRGLGNIKLVLAKPNDPGLPAQKLDLILLVDVYHELDEPATVLKRLAAALQPTGRIAVVEFREEDEKVPILPLHKMSKGQVFREFQANGLKLVGQFDGLPWQHLLFFSARDSPTKKVGFKEWAPGS